MCLPKRACSPEEESIVNEQNEKGSSTHEHGKSAFVAESRETAKQAYFLQGGLVDLKWT